LYDLLAMKLGKETAENLTNFIENKINQELENKTHIFATKEDLANTKSELLKWMFIFWVTQLSAMIGLILPLLKK
jgi:hypothetical protein